MTSMAYAAGPVGFMLAGPLVDAFGLKTTFLALAVPIVIVGLLCPWLRPLHDLDSPPWASPTLGLPHVCQSSGVLGRPTPMTASSSRTRTSWPPIVRTAPWTPTPGPHSRWSVRGDDRGSADRPALGHRYRIAVVPRGAGTGLSGGSTAVDGGIVLSTEKMRAITVDSSTRTAIVQPGLLNAEVKSAVAEHGLWYPPDPSSFEICSIGGNIATNAGGLCCVKYGVTSDYVLGLQVVLADGTAVRLGGPRLKDVAGLSLTKLFVGSEGTLGVVTEVTLRLLPNKMRRAPSWPRSTPYTSRG